MLEFQNFRGFFHLARQFRNLSFALDAAQTLVRLVAVVLARNFQNSVFTELFYDRLRSDAVRLVVCLAGCRGGRSVS